MKKLTKQAGSRIIGCLLLGIWCLSLLLAELPAGTVQAKTQEDPEATKLTYYTEGEAISFHDFFDFERGYVNWKEPTVDGEKVLQITKGPLYSLKDLPKEYTISFMARSTTDYLSVKMTTGFKRDDAADSTVLIDGPANNIVLIADSETFASGKAYTTSGYQEGNKSGIYLESPMWLEMNEWYGVTLKAEQDQLHVFINGEFIYTIQDEDGFDGCFVLRSNNNKALQLKNLKFNAGPDALVYDQAGKPAGNLSCAAMILPGKTETFVYTPDAGASGKATVRIYDASGTVYETADVTAKDGTYTYQFIPRGVAGCQRVTFTIGGKEATCYFYLQHITEVVTGDQSFDFFYNMLQTQLVTWPEGDVFTLDNGDRFSTSVGWIRDDTFTLDGSKYISGTSQAWIDFYLQYQREDGMLFEKIDKSQTPQTYFYYLPKDCYKYINEDIGGVARLEVEADVEYLLIQAAYQTWKATGDDAWMKEIVSKLDQALTYIRTSELRWSDDYGLAIRPSTIDTWDYSYLNEHRAVSPWWNPKAGFAKTPMSIFYGDNTGYYQAACQLAEMYRVTGNQIRMKYWLKEASYVRKNLMEVAWNGNYFAHMVHISPTVDEAPSNMKTDFEKDWERLSLSLAYTLNRGFLKQSEGESIIKTFRDFRDNPPAIENTAGLPTDQLYFAEFVTIYPAYLNGFGGASSIGNSMNAVLGSFTAGALARGSYLYGYSAYGSDILDRLKALCVRDGEIHFTYTRDGEVLNGIGPANWGVGSIYAGVTEGLVGVRDEGKQYKYATVAPAWTSTGYDQVYASTSYGASNEYVAYAMKHNKTNKTVNYTVTGTSEQMNLQLLLPTGQIPTAVTVNGKSVEWHMKAAGEDVWAIVCLRNCKPTDVQQVQVTYQAGQASQSAFDYKIPGFTPGAISGGDSTQTEYPGVIPTVPEDPENPGQLDELDHIPDEAPGKSGGNVTTYVIIIILAVVICVVITTTVVVIKKRS